MTTYAQKAWKRFRIILTYYGSIAPFNLMVTAACCWLFIKLGSAALPVLIFFKVVVLALSHYFVYLLQLKSFVYYSNLGVSNGRLWGVSSLVDLTVFAVVLLLASLIFL